MRIAFISTILSYPWGGADTLWTRAAEAAHGRGDVLFLSLSSATASHSRVRALVQQGAALLIREPSSAPLSFSTRVLRHLRLARRPDDDLIGALQTFRPDLVIFSQGGTYDLLLHHRLAAWLRHRGIRYRIIANWQQEKPHLDEEDLAAMRKTLVAAESIAFVSTRNLATTRRHLHLPLPNAEVLQNPLRWQSSDATPWPDSAVAQLATVSRLEESKGVHLLLHALKKCGPALPAWRLNIHGVGPHESDLRTITGQLGLEEQVHFLGHVGELRAIWGANHLMISPALEDGVPMTIPEAMLCQRPILANCVGGAEDWVQDGVTGFLCPVPQADLLTATLRRAFAARSRWAVMGQAAAESAFARYVEDDYLKLIAP